MPIDLLAENEPVDLLADEGSSHVAPSKGFLGNYADYAKGVGLGAVQGLGDVGASILNTPGFLYKSFTGNEPYHVPHPSLQKYYPSGMAGKIGSTLGEFMAPFAVPAVGQARAAELATTGLGKLAARMGAGSALGFSESEGDRGLGAIVGGAASTIPQIYAGGKALYNYAKKPNLDLSKIENYIEELSKSSAKRQSSFEEQKTALNKYLNEQNEKLKQENQVFQDKLAEHYPIKSLSETRSRLSEESQLARKELESQFEKRYKEFSKEQGEKSIKTPMVFDDFLRETEGLKGLSKTLKELRVNPNKKIIKYESSAGETKEIQLPGKNATVDDYTSFMRELRDASYDAFQASKNATYGDKMELLQTYRSLQKLQNNVEKKIEESIGKENYNKFRNIQSDYAGTIGSLRSEKALTDAAYKKKISDSVFDVLLQPAHKKLKDFLLKRPGYAEALKENMLQGAQHPISSGAITNPAKVNQDIYKILSNPQRASFAEHAALQEQSNAFQDVVKALRSPETMTEIQKSVAKKYSPEIESFLNRSAHEKSITQQMEKEAQSLGLSKKELENQIKNRKMYIAIGGAVALPSGLKALYNKLF